MTSRARPLISATPSFASSPRRRPWPRAPSASRARSVLLPASGTASSLMSLSAARMAPSTTSGTSSLSPITASFSSAPASPSPLHPPRWPPPRPSYSASAMTATSALRPRAPENAHRCCYCSVKHVSHAAVSCLDKR
ncbi:cytoplasmic linker protein 190, partial [Thecamonas trahens ATCC 50062]